MDEKEIKLIEPQVRLHYRLLKHAGFKTLAHCQDVHSGVVVDRRDQRTSFLSSEGELVDWARQFNGKGNLFIGRNPRHDDGALAGVTSFSFDIDPVRPKGVAATAEQRRHALAYGHELLRAFPGGVLLDSGNGVHIFYVWNPITGDIEQFKRQCVSFQERVLASAAIPDGLVLDKLFNPGALVKLAGSVSTKGERKDWRVAQFLDASPLTKDGTKVLGLIQSGADKSGREGASTQQQILSVGTEADSRSVGIVGTAYKSRSEADFALASKLKLLGCSREDVLDALKHHALRDRPDDFIRIVDKVFADAPEQKGLQIFSPQRGLDEYRRFFFERKSRAGRELPTGLKNVDAIAEVVRRRCLTVIGARTGVGKTAFALSVCASLLQCGKRVLYFSTEMDLAQLYARVAAIVTGDPVSGETGAAGAQKAEKEFERISQALSNLDLHISDGFEPTLGDVSRAVASVQPDIFVFDHIQHVGSETQYRVQELSKFIKGLKNLARQSNAAALVCSQLNRVAATETPQLHHLKETGCLEEESDVAVLMRALSSDTNLNLLPIECSIKKNRHGQVGSTQIVLNRPLTRMEDLGVSE